MIRMILFTFISLSAFESRALATIISLVEFESSGQVTNGGRAGVNLEPLLNNAASSNLLVDIGWEGAGVFGSVSTNVSITGFSDVGSNLQYHHNDNGGMGLVVYSPYMGTTQLDGDLNEGFVISYDQDYEFDNIKFAGGNGFNATWEVELLGLTYTGTTTTNGGSFRQVGLFIPANTPLRVTVKSGRMGLKNMEMRNLGQTASVPEPNSVALLSIGAIAIALRRTRHITRP